MGFVRFMLPFWLMFTMCLINFSLEFEPVDNFLIDCGSSRNNSLGDRVFIADTFDHSYLSTPRNVFVNTTSSSLFSSAYDLVLYQTARIFTGVSNYTFSIQKHGHHFIRLHFFPFVDQSKSFDLSRAEFSVVAQDFTLLRNFRPQSEPAVKEYSLNISSDNFVLTFIPSDNSFAFLNALEIISLPDELIPSTAQTFDPQGEQRSLISRALQTMERVNMGNQSVSRQNDTLYRFWDSDESYLTHRNLVNFSSSIRAANFTRGQSRNIAPPSVYGTVTRLNTQFDPNSNYNMTWLFRVDPGFEYLVRFHFCDIVSTAPDSLFFNVFINSFVVASRLDLSNLTSNRLGTPYFMDVVTSLSENGELNVSIGPTNVRNDYPDGILNGVEIMKISNSRGSLDDVAESERLDSKTKVWVIVGSATGGLILLVVLVLGLVFFMARRSRRRTNGGHLTLEQFAANGKGKTNGSTSVISKSKIGYRFPFVAIKDATDNFAENLVVGIGGFGKVYKGILWDGTKVAVKRGAPHSNQGLPEFITEIEMLSQFRHRHLVSLIGYCDEQNEMIIIYEYMENGTLKDHLYGSDLPKLSWRQRLEICIGSAKGLHYLHTGSSKAIIHRDVKSANILLDENFKARVADFGISKDGPDSDIDQTHVSTAVKGSFGYLDPEYLIRQQLTEKSDVYSFGVVMLEILSAKPVIDPSRPRSMVNLVDWARMLQENGKLEQIIDPFLVGTMKTESFDKFVEVVEKCLAERGVDRPTMGDVLWNLESALKLEGVQRKSNELPVLPSNHFEASVSFSTQFSVGSAGDMASMSRVFSQMVNNAEMR